MLLVREGIWSRDFWGMNPEVQWLANRGYAVLQVNYRGSTGFGKAFLHAGDKEWGPWNVAHRVVSADFSCRPCGLDGCGGSKVSECLTTLPVAQVLAACEELLV
mgnify:CR=1 FL=1